MAPKQSCKGKKRSKKSSQRSSRKRSCPKKPSLFMDDIRYMQFKKAAQDAAQYDATTISYNPFDSKYLALTIAWENFYNSVNLQYITPKFLNDASNELTLALVPLIMAGKTAPYSVKKIISALTDLTKPIIA